MTADDRGAPGPPDDLGPRTILGPPRPPRAPLTPRRRAGIALMALGIATIVGAVLHVLEEANGPGAGPTTFAERRSYDMVKESVHDTFPLAFLAGVVGLGITMLGARMGRSAD